MEPIKTIMDLIDPPPVRGMIVVGEICLPEPEERLPAPQEH